MTKPLTHRELMVLNEMANGRTIPETAILLTISENTVHAYRRAIMTKLHARNSGHAVAIGFREGLLN